MSDVVIHQRHLPLAGAYNIRDVGGYHTQTGRVTRWRRLLRADALHALTPAAQAELLAYGVHTIIDLRFAQECAAAPNVLAASPAIRYYARPLFPGSVPISPQGQPAYDLESMYRLILDKCQAPLAAVFDIVPQTERAVLVHCTAGKDRTGMVIALLLGLAGVDEQTIAQDYALTAEYAAPLFVTLRAQAAANGRDLAIFERFLEAKPEAMLRTLAYLRLRYGSIPAYFHHLGFDDARLAQLHDWLTEPAVSAY
jgi:protein-tyrosine phosphatase